MEQFDNPYLDKLVGLPQKHKDKEDGWKKHSIETIEIAGGEKIKELELEKTQTELEFIAFADIGVNELLKKYGRKKQISIPLDNIHILRKNGVEEYTKEKAFTGAHSSLQQSIIVDRVKSDIQFTLILFHELCHVKSYSALQIIPGTKENPPRLGRYRSGISATSRDGKTEYLGNIEEAITGYLTKQFYSEKILPNTRFSKEVEDIREGRLHIDTSRKEELEKLNEIIDAIFEKHTNRFSSKEEILNLFMDAYVNGNLIQVGRLIETTFGQGILRTLDRTSND